MLKTRQKKIILVILFVVVIMAFLMLSMRKDIGIEDKEDLEDLDVMNLEMEIIAYQHSILNFTELTAEEVNEKISNDESFFLYVGRVTCQWCRRMVPKLSKIVKTYNIRMYYLDSEESDTNSVLSKFREQYGVESVPQILYFSGNSSILFPIDYTEENLEYLEQLITAEFNKIL